MDYKKPQSTLVQGGAGIYPLTTADQVILADGSRLEKDGKISADFAADSAKLGGKAPEYYIQPRNLLDNSDFTNPVNQRGQTSYTGYAYKIDRWFSSFSTCKLDIRDGYIEISGDGLAVQRTKAKNGTYSAFAENTDGNIVELPTDYTAEIGCVQTYLPDGKWKWAALYEGAYTADTLPPYVPKGYAQELETCRFYARPFIKTAPAVAITVTSIRAEMVLDPPMRIAPTITIDSVGDAYTPEGKKSISSSYSDTNTADSAGYVFYTGSVTTGVPCVITGIKGFLSADL